MRNYITNTTALNSLMVYAKASEGGTGQAPAPEEPTVPTAEVDPWAGFEQDDEVIGVERGDKYGWDTWPAPKAKLGEDGKPTGEFFFAKKRVDLDGVKVDSVRGSLKKYLMGLKAKGKPEQDFRTVGIKDDKDVVVALMVQRIK